MQGIGPALAAAVAGALADAGAGTVGRRRRQVRSSNDAGARTTTGMTTRKDDETGAGVTPTSGAGAELADVTGPIRLGVPATTGELLVITGMSGAGRSTAAKVLEDLGWYVVDNLPPQLIESLAGARPRRPGRDVPRLAVAVDVRGRSFFAALRDGARRSRRARGIGHRVLFLDATDEALVRRFESVRRPHPLQGEGRLLDGIVREREAARRAAPVRRHGDRHLATSTCTSSPTTSPTCSATRRARRCGSASMSFGFKYGLPLDADHVADVRFLPNPFWVPELRPHTGLDPDVRAYVLGQPGAEPFLTAYAPRPRTGARGLRPREEALRDHRHRAAPAASTGPSR